MPPLNYEPTANEILSARQELKPWIVQRGTKVLFQGIQCIVGDADVRYARVHFPDGGFGWYDIAQLTPVDGQTTGGQDGHGHE